MTATPITVAPPPSKRTSIAPRQELALTIGWHWDPTRIGATAMIRDGIPVARETAPFGDDDCVISSKAPMTFQWTAAGSLIFYPSHRVHTTVFRKVARGPFELQPDALAAGVPILLGRRILVVLHLRPAPLTDSVRAFASQGMTDIYRDIVRYTGNVLIRACSPAPALALAAALDAGPVIRVDTSALSGTSTHAKEVLFGTERGVVRQALLLDGAATSGAGHGGAFNAISDGGTLLIEEVIRIPAAVRDMLLVPVRMARAPGPLGIKYYRGRLICVTTASPTEIADPDTERLARSFDMTVSIAPLHERRADIGPAVLRSIVDRLTNAHHSISPSWPPLRWIARPDPDAAPLLRPSELLRLFCAHWYPKDEETLDTMVGDVLGSDPFSREQPSPE